LPERWCQVFLHAAHHPHLACLRLHGQRPTPLPASRNPGTGVSTRARRRLAALADDVGLSAGARYPHISMVESVSPLS
jgi:hypothetical protein